MKICHLSPANQQAREFNVRRERKNYRREAERLRTSTALTVSEEQSKELAKLIECISSSEEGQEAVKAVCNKADEQQPGSGAILKELWELEGERRFLKFNEGMVSQCCINTGSFHKLLSLYIILTKS